METMMRNIFHFSMGLFLASLLIIDIITGDLNPMMLMEKMLWG
jgi:hypothetical protein